MKTTLVAQGAQDTGSLEGALIVAVTTASFDRLDVAVAYATKQGILALKAAMGGEFPPLSRWVVGLDDAITQPEALSYLLHLPGAELRLAALSPARRFHPKLYCLWRSDEEATCLSAIGSGNMTLRGLRENGEAAVLLGAESKDEAEALKKQWQLMWSLGEAANQAAIDAYKERYKQAKKQREKIVDLGVAPPEPDPVTPVTPIFVPDNNPATARHALLEIGKATGGKEVEIPKKLLPFFRIPPGVSSVFRQMHLPNGTVRPLRLIDRKGNFMWRIEFSAEVINVIAGRNSFYQPNGDRRSELALAFQHIENTDDFSVQTITLNGQEYDALKNNSSSAGALKRTINGPTGRDYGVF